LTNSKKVSYFGRVRAWRSLFTARVDEHTMIRGIRGYSQVAIAAWGLLALGCEAGGIGDPCIPEAEYDLYFNNFSEADVFAETRSFQCETRLCLVNHFQGRVSCPYGQTQQDLDDQDANYNGNRPVDLGALCKVPGTSGTAPPVQGITTDPDGQMVSADVIQVPVAPRLVNRRPDDAVYCSCRCKNDEGKTDDGANYCECPSGYACERLIRDPGLGKPELAGYYCIKEGTRYQQASVPCSREEDRAAAGEGACGDGNNP
jgi:hypothetical protein